MTTAHDMAWGSHRLSFGGRTLIMGIVNVTPDSFSDGGRFFTAEAAVAKGLSLIADGADILDIGGESTRPFSDPVSASEEIRRVVPVIRELSQKSGIPISIDTSKAIVAREALKAGASVINDVSALMMDPEMAQTAARAGVPVILMHMKKTPRTMQVAPVYTDVVGEVLEFLAGAAENAVKRGVDRSRIIIDPGIGFGKTLSHNLEIMNRLEEFAALGYPLLVGTSRKTFLRKLLFSGKEEIPADLPEVECATQASIATAILKGTHAVRVHDVRSARITATIIDAVLNPSRDRG